MNKLEKSLLVVSLILSALSSNAAEEGSEFRIVASFSILGDMAQAVVGDLATVIAIVGPNADAAHLPAFRIRCTQLLGRMSFL